MRIHRAVLAAVIAALSLVVVRAALDEDRVARLRPGSSAAPTSDAANSEDCCIESHVSNFSLTPVSSRGNNCPSSEVPLGSESSFDPQTGRIEIHFYDAALGEGRTFIIGVEDPACFDYPATRAVLFGELVVALQTDPSVSGDEARACARLKAAVRSGALKLDGRGFDLRSARPYVDEVCPDS